MAEEELLDLMLIDDLLMDDDHLPLNPEDMKGGMEAKINMNPELEYDPEVVKEAFEDLMMLENEGQFCDNYSYDWESDSDSGSIVCNWK